MFTEPYRQRDHPNDRVLLHTGSSVHVLYCYDNRNASRSTEEYYFRQCLDHHWRYYPGDILLGGPDCRGASPLCKSFHEQTLIQSAKNVTGIRYCREILPLISVMQGLTNGSFLHAIFPCIW